MPRPGVAGLCVLLLSAWEPVLCEVAEDSSAQADLGDLDLGDLDSDDDEEEDDEPAGDSAEPVDFDQDMPEAQRLMRMKVCLAGASARLHSNAEAVSKLAQQLVESRPGISLDQATNSVFFTWMMTCYINIADADAEAAAQGNADVLKDVRLYEPNPESPPVAQTASRRQWNFLIDVVKEHMSQQDAALKAQDRKDRQKSQSDSGAGQPPPVQEPPVPSSGSKASILLLALVFGIIGLGTMFLMRKEKEEREEKERKKSSRKDKKKNH